MEQHSLWLITLLMLLYVHEILSANQPNIIFVIADDMGWHDVGFHGSDMLTPNIDKLAYEGVILNNYYVSPICSPTRSAIMTGRHPIHTGMQHEVIGNDTPYGLPLNFTIMPQYLKALGYDTHAVGKWHLGHFKKEYLPTLRGFDSFFGYLTGHEDYFDHVAEGSPYWGKDFRNNTDPVATMDGDYSTELYTSLAENIISTHNQSKPLFLYLAYQAVHAGNSQADPLQAPQKYIDRFPNITNIPRKIFGGMVSALDDGIGNLRSVLEKTGMMNNTVLVFTTDNGGPTNGYDRNAACNWPLRGCKNTMWEGGVRGNGFVHSPLLRKTGYIMDNLMHITDWLPTIYSLAGGNASDLPNQDGYNVWNMLSDDGQPIRTSVLHNIDPIQNFAAIRVGEYKLVMGDISNGRDDSWYPPPDLKKNHHKLRFNDKQLNNFKGDKFTYRMSSEKMSKPITVNCGKRPVDADTNCLPKSKPCLFHIPTDPCEFTNIAYQHPEIVAELYQKIEEYKKTMVPPGNKPADPKGANPYNHGGFWGPWM
ncbi:arylsulfatase J isoform X1 [Patella vulgata]|uniref:arylsulfatase J isoform X1 n=1 Tax=Patella vulgata TaxID=6465 RepID=UPI00217FBDE8|nr:arylsulfatase J isoform X1 [Patella vulgata]